MKYQSYLLLGLLVSSVFNATGADMRRLSREELLDKIRGAWAGQMIGVSYGASTEFRAQSKMLDAEIKPDALSNAIQQDDLYVEMTFAKVMDTVGLDAKPLDYGKAFRDSQYSLWHANASARRNLARGIMPPLSGSPLCNLHADDIDFQIEADFIGIMCPGLPRFSNRYCARVGQVMNYGDGVYGGMFVCGMYTAAYFEKDPRKIVEAGLACLPAKSSYAALIRDVLAFAGETPGDWKATWTKLEQKWNRHDPCPDGALTPFNIDAKLNGAYIAIGLLHGGGDLRRTMEVSTRCGQDSDCNPSSAAGVIGAIIGYRQIPEEYRSELDKLAATKFAYTDYSFNDMVQSSEKRTLEVIRQAGGKVTESEVSIPLQTPKPAKLEQCNFGLPVKLVGQADPAWRWRGAWTTAGDAKVSAGAGQEAVLRFEGTGIALVGNCTQDGGRADIYLDGRKQKLVADAWIPERTHDNDLWHRNDLSPGAHTLRVVTRPDSNPKSKGTKLSITRAILYQK